MSGAEESPLAAALGYAARDWAVLPCHSPATGGRCSCGRGDCASPAKHPRLARGLTSASTEAAQIEHWWRRWLGANVAVRTGAASGLVVIDVDPRHGGEGSLEALVAEHGGTPGAGLVATGGG
ncbi:MAG: bifunctional DNA primase/polymerase, partial [Actinobacteria bacterium]|nr:bifunctional DNA primase/polymerase [Actinomycetota bacterium]